MHIYFRKVKKNIIYTFNIYSREREREQEVDHIWSSSTDLIQSYYRYVMLGFKFVLNHRADMDTNTS